MDFGRLSEIRMLQRGGEALVYKARLDGKTPVAVKVYSNGNCPDDKTAAFLQEPVSGVSRILEWGKLDGNAFSVSEYIRGIPSSQVSPMPIREAVGMMRRICETLSRTVEKGVFHGDLNPENVLVSEDGTPVLVDFGIRGLGAPRFAAPERFEGALASVESELFSLGAMLYFWISGEPLLGGETFEAIESAVFRVDSLDVNSLLLGRGVLPLKEILSVRDLWKGTLCRNPSERFESFDEFDENLEIAENNLRKIQTESFQSVAIWKKKLAERIRERERRIETSPVACRRNFSKAFGTKSFKRRRLALKILSAGLILLGSLLLFIYIGRENSRTSDIEDVGNVMLKRSRTQKGDDALEKNPMTGIRGILVDSDSSLYE